MKKTKDMTVGSPIKLIIMFAIPLFIGNIFQQIYNIVDMSIAGHCLGEDAIAAIGCTSMIYSLVMNVTWGFNNGFGIVVAQKFGAKDIPQLRRSIAVMIRLNIRIVIALTVISVAALKPVMRLLNTPQDIWNDAYAYIVIILGGLIMTMAYNLCGSLLRALGNSMIPLIFLAIASVINVGLDTLFLVVFRTGIWGVAAATIIAQFLSALACMLYIMKYYKEYLPERADFAKEPVIQREMLSTGFSMALMNSVFAIGSVVLQGGINKLGTEVITAHTAARRIVEMFMQPLNTLSVANSTFVSQNWGAREVGRIRATLRKVFLLEEVWAFFAMCMILLFGKYMLILLTGSTSEGVLSNGLMNIRINSMFFYPLGILFVLRTSMQAMGRKVAPVVSSSLELAVKVLAVFLIIPTWGYLGASFAEPSTWLICMIFLVIDYLLIRKKLFVKTM